MTRRAPRAVALEPSSRRAVLRAAGATAAGGAAALLAACTTHPRKPAPTESPGLKPRALRVDVPILNQALDVEHHVIAAYTAGIPLLSGQPLSAARRFLQQEFAHAAELSALIRKGGGKPNPTLPSYDLGNPTHGADVLDLLHALERQSIATYLDVIPRLQPGIVRSTVASILANEAEHVSVLRSALGLAPVPGALVSSAE